MMDFIRSSLCCKRRTKPQANYHDEFEDEEISDFESAASFFSKHSLNFPDETQLKAYGLYKQTLYGDAPGSMQNTSGFFEKAIAEAK